VDADKLKFVTSLIEYPEETALAEYKSAVLFDAKSEFGVKLIKHILGLANTGGGYIVIGFQEDSNGKLAPDPDLTEEISRSYETTRLSQSVDSALAPGQRIELQVHKVSSGKVYPVVSVQGFRGTPFFCGKESPSPPAKPILKEGAIYIRDVAAKTVLTASPEHWNIILKTAIGQRQNEFVEHLRSLLQEFGIRLGNPELTSNLVPVVSEPASDSTPVVSESANDGEVQKWLDTEAAVARSQAGDLPETAGFFEVRHYPLGVLTRWNQAELALAAQKSVCRNTGWPIGVVMTKPEFAPAPTVTGIRAVIKSGGTFDYWSLGRQGAFYFLRRLDEDSDQDQQRKGGRRWIYFDTRIWRVAETFLHCSNLYRSLDLPLETPIFVEITHAGLAGRTLGVADRMRMLHWERTIQEDVVTWSRTLPLGSIEASLSDLTREATGELFMLFEFWQVSDQAFRQIFDHFRSSSV
jgi:hypothetical protein